MNITWQYKQNHFIGDGENDARIYTARHNHKLRCVVSGPGIGQNTQKHNGTSPSASPNATPTKKKLTVPSQNSSLKTYRWTSSNTVSSEPSIPPDARLFISTSTPVKTKATRFLTSGRKTVPSS